MEGHRSVLIAPNGAPGALDEGLRLAQQGNCWVTVLSVLPPYEGELDLTGVRNVRQVMDAGRARTARELEKAVIAENAARVRVEQGDNAETIRRVASEEGSDIIVLGVNKKAGMLVRWFEKGLVRRLRRTAPCPVMVIEA